MKDHLIKAISGGLHGNWVHTDPKKILKAFTPANARKKPDGASHSCWELLHHAIVWQDAILCQIKGETVDWNDIEKKNNWPTAEAMTDDMGFEILVEKFTTGIKEAKKMLESVDFTIEHSLGDDLPPLSTIKLFTVLLQHNSYHIGQLITIRKIIGDWPPTEK